MDIAIVHDITIIQTLSCGLPEPNHHQFYDKPSSTAISSFVSTTYSFPETSSSSIVGIAATPSFTEDYATSISTEPPSAPAGGSNGTLIIAAGAAGGLVALTLATTAAIVLYRTCRPSSAKPQFAESMASALAAEQPGEAKYLTSGGGTAHLDATSTPVPPRGGGGNGGNMSHNPNGGRGEDPGSRPTRPGPGQITSHQPNVGPAWHGQPVPNGGGGGLSYTPLGPGSGAAPSAGRPTSYTSLPPGGAVGAGVAPGGGPTSITNTTPSYGPFLHATGPAASFVSGTVGAASGGPLIQSTPFAVVGPQHGHPNLTARAAPVVPDSERTRQEAYQSYNYLYTGTHGAHPHQMAYYSYHPPAPGMQIPAHHPNAYAGGPPQQAYVTQPPPNGAVVYPQQPLPSTIVYSEAKPLPPRPDESKHDFSASTSNAPSPSSSRHDAPSTVTTSWLQMHPYEKSPPTHPMSSGQPTASDISTASNASPVLTSAASTETSLGSDAAWPSQGSAPARIAPVRMSSLVNRVSEVTGEMAGTERKE
ncbi:hypothetical protein HDU96_007432 [Phlyctochytrium bullatum]|nr:hypothetical protein HDU96_007432 [Phlyctochytrium bullatum]